MFIDAIPTIPGKTAISWCVDNEKKVYLNTGIFSDVKKNEIIDGGENYHSE